MNTVKKVSVITGASSGIGRAVALEAVVMRLSRI